MKVTIVLAKRLSEKQKEEILRKFRNGFSLDLLAKEFKCTKLTISRNLKKYIGDHEFKLLNINNSDKKNKLVKKGEEISDLMIDNQSKKEIYADKVIENKDLNKNIYEAKDYYFSPFTELTPLNEDIENTPQKDLSSVPISEISLPSVVYMVVDKKIELEIKTLNDYPEWQFLSDNELQRKTIEIFLDLKIAKRNCRNDQKVIKVPNTKVFESVAPILTARGISRIISDNKLIAL